MFKVTLDVRLVLDSILECLKQQSSSTDRETIGTHQQLHCT
jgi:hypothetical protein